MGTEKSTSEQKLSKESGPRHNYEKFMVGIAMAGEQSNLSLIHI